MADKQFTLSVLFKVLDKATRPIRKIGTSLKKLVSPVKRLIKSFQKLGRSVQKVGNRMVQIGKTMILRVAAPLFLLGFLLSRTSRTFETAFTGIRKTVDATEPQFKKLKVELMDLARELGIATEEIFGLAEGAGQLAIQRENIAKFVEVIAKLGIAAPVLEIEAAAFQIAQFANVTQMSQKDFDKFVSTLVFLGNNSATSEDRILNMTERVASAARGAGLAHSEILGLATALAQLGLKAEGGGTAFSMVINEITKQVALGGKKLEGIAALAGLKGQTKEFKKLWKENAVEGLMLFIEGLEGLKKKGIEAVVVLDDLGMDGRRVSDALRRASGNSKLFNQTIKAGNRAWKENIAANEEVSKRMKDVQKQLDQVKENARQAAMAFGDELNVTLLKVVKGIDPLITKLRELDLEMKQLILIIGGVGIGLVGALLGLGTILRFVGFALAGLTISTGAYGLALAGLGFLAFSVWKNFKDLKEIFTNLWNDPIEELKIWKETLKLMVEEQIGIFNKLQNSIGNLQIKIAKLIGKGALSIWKTWSGNIIKEISTVLIKIKEIGKSLSDFLFSHIKEEFGFKIDKESPKEKGETLPKKIIKSPFRKLKERLDALDTMMKNLITAPFRSKKEPLGKIKTIGPKESLANAVRRVMTETEPIKSQTEVHIEVTAEPGTSAKIKKIERKSGDAKTTAATTGFVGAMP